MAAHYVGVERNVIVELLKMISPDHTHNGGEEVIDGESHVVAVDEVAVQLETHKVVVDEIGVGGFGVSQEIFEC